MKMLLTPTFAALIVLLTLITRVNCADSTRPSRDTRETEPVQATSRETGDAEPGRASSRETRDAESLRRDTRDTDVVRAKVYFAIAVSAAGQAYTRAFNKTLINMTQSHLAGELTNYYNYKKVTYNISLETLVIELPENGSFSAALLERLCGTFEGKHVVAVLVVGSSPAAFTVSLAAQHAGIPVLWARGQSEFVPGFRSLILHETGQKETYGSLLKKCIQTAIELKSRNINKGDIVVISPENDLHSCVPMIASMFIGAIPFMTYPKFKAELVEILKLNPKILFSEKETADTVLKSSQENGELTTEIFVFGSNFEEIFLQPRESEDVFLPITTEDLFQTCMMVSSSGTASGISKPVCMKHSSFVKYPEKITGSVVPTAFINHKSWHWVSCIIDFYFCILRGDVMIRSRRFYKILPPDYDVNILWEMVEKYKISSISVLPTLVKPLFGSKNVNHDVSSVRLFITVGSPMLEGYESAIKTILPEVKIINLYGSTEAGAAFTFDFTNEKHRKLHEERPNSVGLPSDGYSIKVVNPDTEMVVGPNELGELRLKSKHFLANGYYNSDWTDCFDDDGWFKTGDLVYFDEKYRFFIKDRLKFIISSTGLRTQAGDFESILMKHHDVYNAAVIGVPIDNILEHPTGVVVLKDGAKVTEKELLDFVHEKVNYGYSKLTGGIKFVKSLPLTAVGKVMKLKLKQMVMNKEVF